MRTKTDTNIQFDNNLISWYMYINSGVLKPLRWQRPLFKVLHAALMGKVSKILISAPPQHGKTMLTINAFVSLYMCNNPDDKVIVTAYSQQRATKYGLYLRNIINRFGKNTMFRPRLAQDQQSKTNFLFEYPHTGELLATGSHGSIMGNPANLIVIDDPIKELREATSVLMQENLEDWYVGSINTRLRKNDIQRPPILIIVAQRLHKRDLQGILQDKYKVLDGLKAMQQIEAMNTIPADTLINLNFPALCENPDTDILHRKKNEPLWAEHKNTDELLIERDMMGEYRFKTIMQGDPQNIEDYLFDDTMFYDSNHNLTCTVQYKEVPPQPVGRFWDTAAKSKKRQTETGGDYYAGIQIGYDYKSETMYIFNMKHGKCDGLTLANLIKATAIADGPERLTYIGQEPGSLSVAFLEVISAYLQNKGFTVLYKTEKDNKLFRSLVLQSIAARGGLKFVTYPNQDTSWIHTVIDELTHFDGKESDASKGKHDDIVDALTEGANYFSLNRNYYGYQ